MCNCNEKVNSKLSDHNTVLDIPFTVSSGLGLGFGKVKIVTAKKDSKVRKKPVTVFASFCPFCGEKYQAPGDAK